MTFGWLKSFIQAASFRNSSISFWEKLSTVCIRDRKVKYLQVNMYYSLEIIKGCILATEISHFIVFTATFSDVPSGCLKCPSTTEPNSPGKLNQIINTSYTYLRIQISQYRTVHSPSPRTFPIESKILMTITSWSLAWSSSLTPRFPTADSYYLWLFFLTR